MAKIVAEWHERMFDEAGTRSCDACGRRSIIALISYDKVLLKATFFCMWCQWEWFKIYTGDHQEIKIEQVRRLRREVLRLAKERGKYAQLHDAITKGGA